MNTILITGGAGFIGANLISKLIQNPENFIICLDNLVTGKAKNIERFRHLPNFRFFNHNVINHFETDFKIDQIYHLASPASPPNYQKDAVFTFRTNVWGTFNFLELAKKYNAKFLLASTSEIYGDPNVHPQPENYWGNVNTIGIRSCYDEGKRASETLTMDYWRQYKSRIKIIRIFNTYGSFMDALDGRVVSNFINQALQNQDITIYGDGSQSRSFQYVDDLIDGIIAVMATDDKFLGPVNLGNPNEFTVLELAQKILELIPQSKSRIVNYILPQDDPKQRKPDIALAKLKLNWEPRIQLLEGLQKTIAYFKSLL
jgi:UDP-glucuronate decarboxylase